MMTPFAGTLKNRILPSPIASGSMIRPRGQSMKKPVGASLMLTSLVDAFSILVIFLMMNSASESSPINGIKSIKLPEVQQATLTLEAPTLRIENGRYKLADQDVDVSQLFERLSALTKKGELIIIADREMDYKELNPVVVLGSRAGFSELKFAVLKK